MSELDANKINNTPINENLSRKNSNRKLGKNICIVTNDLNNYTDKRKTSGDYECKEEPIVIETYESIRPFDFPQEDDYQIMTSRTEMAKKLNEKKTPEKPEINFVSDSDFKQYNQKVADNRIEYYTSRLEKITPNPKMFKKDEGRNPNRIKKCLSLQGKISSSQAFKNRDAEPNDEQMDFAFEGLLYKFVDNGLFSDGDRKANPIFTSDFDDFVNAGGGEEAHATDCAFSVPVHWKTSDGQEKTGSIAIAIAATTSSSRRPNERTGKTVIEEKIDKYPKNQAYVEFSVNKDGSHRPAAFMPVFVLGFQHDKVREILTTCNNLDECLTDTIKHNFYLQIIAQCNQRIKALRSGVKKGNKQAQEAYKKYRVLSSTFLDSDEKLCEKLNIASNSLKPWGDKSADCVIEASIAAGNRITQKKAHQ